ncbi:ferrochelatase [Nitratifractor sp.]|uniref:ferrochelatase n=1 Tax=Nitratifractor sp. TaxID=2268144 RepID=UPI0025EAD96B|nr:ferrochelatase [Nitratifractor sp.]
MRKKGVLLLNMGGPNNLDEVELFLRNMFADPRILPMSAWMRKRIGAMIVRRRLEEAQENYRELGGKSPLTEITWSLTAKVETRSGVLVRPAMRYVPPFADPALRECAEEGVEELVLFPMYPHYSTTTTLSSVEDVAARCEAMGYHPEIRVVAPYYDDYDYLMIQAERIREAAEGIETREYDLILSAHGLPMSIIRTGDPYEKQVEANVSALKTMLRSQGIIFKNIKLAYQSKVGNAAWLEPNLADLLRRPENLKVLIFPLAFTVDNSETLFELDREHRAIAEKIGYEDYRVARCPNDGEDFAAFIAEKIENVGT